MQQVVMQCGSRVVTKLAPQAPRVAAVATSGCFGAALYSNAVLGPAGNALLPAGGIRPMAAAEFAFHGFQRGGQEQEWPASREPLSLSQELTMDEGDLQASTNSATSRSQMWPATPDSTPPASPRPQWTQLDSDLPPVVMSPCGTTLWVRMSCPVQWTSALPFVNEMHIQGSPHSQVPLLPDRSSLPPTSCTESPGQIKEALMKNSRRTGATRRKRHRELAERLGAERKSRDLVDFNRSCSEESEGLHGVEEPVHRGLSESVEAKEPLSLEKVLEHISTADGFCDLQKDIACANESERAVIVECLKDHPEEVRRIVNELKAKAVHTAKNRQGCRVLEVFVEHFPGRETDELVQELLNETEILIRHQWANFVIQHIIKHGSVPHRQAVARVVQADAVRLAKHRVASHVVRCALTHCKEDQRALCAALTEDADSLHDLNHHQCGSFVIREAKKVSSYMQ